MLGCWPTWRSAGNDAKEWGLFRREQSPPAFSVIMPPSNQFRETAMSESAVIMSMPRK